MQLEPRHAFITRILFSLIKRVCLCEMFGPCDSFCPSPLSSSSRAWWSTYYCTALHGGDQLCWTAVLARGTRRQFDWGKVMLSLSHERRDILNFMLSSSRWPSAAIAKGPRHVQQWTKTDVSLADCDGTSLTWRCKILHVALITSRMEFELSCKRTRTWGFRTCMLH